MIYSIPRLQLNVRRGYSPVPMSSLRVWNRRRKLVSLEHKGGRQLSRPNHHTLYITLPTINHLTDILNNWLGRVINLVLPLDNY